MKPFDQNGLFHSDFGNDQVRRLAIRGAGITVFTGGFGLAIQTITTIILARLLTPQDFGVVTMVTTFSLLLANFGLNGFTEAVLQTEKLSHSIASNLFWINVGIGLGLTILLAASGPLMAHLYHDSVVAKVAIGMAPTILLTSLSVLHIALLKRAMWFSATSTNEVISRAISLLTSIIFAWIGWGYWALVVGALMQPLSQTIGAWVLCSWLPGRPTRSPGTAKLVQFAMNVYGRFTLNYFARNTDNLLVGWRFGSNALGFYKKAYDLFVLSAGQLTAPITNVAVAALSRYNPRSEEYRQNLLNAISVTSFIGMGLSGVFVLIGKDLIRVLLGARWDPAGQIFTFFAPGIGAMLLYFVHGWIHLSIGRADRWFRWGILEIVVTFLFFLIGLPWGPDGIAVAWSASYWVLTLPSLWYAGRPIDFGVAPVVSVLWRYIGAAILAGSIVFLTVPRLSHLLTPLGTFDIAALRAISVSLLFGLAYMLAVVVFHGGTKPLVQFGRIFVDMTSRRTQGKAIPPDSLSPRNEPQEQTSSSGVERRPLVSILIPAFNSEEWIADTLKSALAQTWEPKEIIVVDDGSTDRTLSVVRSFSSAGVRVVTQRNQGAAAARNHALRLSRGEYIQWLDADDLLAPDKIALQMEEAIKSDNKRILLSSAFGKFKYRYYRTKFLPSSLWRDQKAADWLVSKLSQNVYMQTATWLVSRELTEGSGPWDIRLLGDDDGEYFCRVLLACDRVKFVPEARVYYRAPWFGTLSHVGSSKPKIDAHWLSMQLHIGYLRSIEDSDRVRRACLRYLQSCFIYFYPERQEIIQSAQSLAKELGGQLSPPQLNWKYSWICKLFGWRVVKGLQARIPRLRWWFLKTWDKTLFRVRTRFSRVSL